MQYGLVFNLTSASDCLRNMDCEDVCMFQMLLTNGSIPLTVLAPLAVLSCPQHVSLAPSHPLRFRPMGYSVSLV